MDSIIAVWDENETRAEELKKCFDSLDVSGANLANISVRCHTKADYPKESEIKATDAVFLSFDGDEGSMSKAADISAFIKLAKKSCLIVLVCDKGTNFNVFYRPSISPSGVICRPFTPQFFKAIFEELVAEIQKSKKDAQIQKNDTLNVKIGGNHYSFFYRDILFFEAQTKKVAVKTFGQEVSYYDSIESIAENLPPYFARCHRSFIINANHIKSAHFGENTIRLKDGSQIPISRSYKDDIRKILAIDN